MQKQRLFPILTAFAVLTALPSGITASAAAAPMRDMTTQEIVRDMGIGINLGNTYESCGDWIAQWGDGSPESYETAWGSPVITQPMIEGIADAGFGVLRVPVAWSNLMAADYTISTAYLEAVQEVVDWALESDLYVIMNLHYDGGWLENFPTDTENCMKKYESIWTQLSTAFIDYGDKLMFESQNEELGWGTLWNRWAGTEGKTESFALANSINQKFVDVVRGSGGNNAKRHLLISGYNTNIEDTCDPLFQMPTDPAGRCAISVHYYTPAGFAILEEDADWGKAIATWGTDADIAELERYMTMMETNYVKKGIPVIIGEYGCPKKNKEEASVRRFLTTVCKAAYDRQMCPVLWDTPGGHYDRETCVMSDPVLGASYLEIAGNPEQPKQIMGDLNADGAVTVADAVILQKHLLRIELLSAKQAAVADLDKNSVIDAFDLTQLKQLLCAAASRIQKAKPAIGEFLPMAGFVRY